ncbi:hypothetical protein AQJ46_46620 [Streptomyces canus]|uniref:ATP/GTP-binding protein n=1 Tax=Streptomyces canus TaxID=58343 RepID=A0A101RL00_9ACTN|nr:hypothetical protein [Streptomyces canus]KUN57545.1 hypothetical protein AQJ46_46620 [Streptomyces canus]
MLSASRPLAVTGAVLAAILLAATVPGGAALADGDPSGGVTCPELVPDCDINAGGGGSAGSGGSGGGGGDSAGGGSTGGGGSAKCVINWKNPDGKIVGEVPCYREGVGWFNSSDECYWDLVDPQPDPDSPEWDYMTGAPAGKEERAKGKVYNRTCPGLGRELTGGTTWSLNPPPGFGGGPTPEELAQEAIKKMRLLGADIGTAPGEGKTGLVGMPVWIWNNKSASTWGPVTESASAPGITVTATATVKKIVYDMGDGGAEVCTTAGTPYKKEYGGEASPDCGYRYTKTSAGQSEDAFNVKATTTWAIHWEGGGQQGDLTTTRDSATVQLTVGEAQVVAKP